MKPTRATPIISAAAVAEVRFGLRMAFSRASVPVMPFRRGSGAPMHPAERTGEDRAEHGDADEDSERTERRPARMPAPPNRPARHGRRTEAGDRRAR